MSELPFKIEPDFDYILDEADRKKFAPLQVTDERFRLGEWEVTSATPEDGFAVGVYYRRRKSGWVSVKERLPDELAAILLTDGKQIITYPKGWENPKNIASFGYSHWMPLPALPQPPRPAAEVAFEEWWVRKSGYAFEFQEIAQAAYTAAVNWAKSHKGEL